MKYLNILILCLVLLFSCDPCEKAECPNPFFERDLQWLPYSEGDKINMVEMNSSSTTTYFDPIERIGVHQVALTFLQKFGWIEREQPISDFGIDMHIEIVQDTIPTGQIFALQIKSGMSYFKEESNGSFIYL